jgi:hypothetical protein
VQEKYLRVNREMPGYIVKEEYKRNRLRMKVGRERQSLRTKWMEGKGGGYQSTAGKKEKKTPRRRRERNTIRETGMPVKKWKD